MKLKDLVVSLKLDKKMNELGAEQDSIFWWVKHIKSRTNCYLWDLVFGKDKNDLVNKHIAAYTIAEIDKMLPDHVEKGPMKYYLFITKTKKTEYFILPDYYIAYVDISHRHYLHSEREAKGVDAHAKMWIYLKKNGLI